MKPPVLSRRFTLEAPEQLADGAGGFVTAWAALGTLWAEVRPGVGGEVRGPQVALARVPYRIVVRSAPIGSDARPKPGQRLREGDRLFPILAVTEADTTGRYLMLHAEEETAR